jgi:hypothetical protein
MLPRIRPSENHEVLSCLLAIAGREAHHPRMATQDRIYRCTKTGREACVNDQSGLPASYRRILSAIQGDTRVAAVLAALPEHPAHQVGAWLDELETLRFVRSAPAEANEHLEMTGGLSVAAVYARYKANEQAPA